MAPVLDHVTDNKTVFDRIDGRLPVWRGVFGVRLDVTLQTKGFSGHSQRRTSCSCWSWSNNGLACRKRWYTCTRRLQPAGLHSVATGQIRYNSKTCLLFLFVALAGLFSSADAASSFPLGDRAEDAVKLTGAGSPLGHGSFSPHDGQNLKVGCSFVPHWVQKLKGILQGINTHTLTIVVLPSGNSVQQ